jgi:hypothetical protein
VTAAPEPLTYVLPLRWEADRGLAELGAYLAGIASEAEVIVVDGSSEARFERHREVFKPSLRHLRPHTDLHYEMGKVNGVLTGVREAGADCVVLADDDVRYGARELAEVAARLRESDLVVPQNYFRPLPWHARWDTARTLINRVWTGDRWFPATDFPGTLGVRRPFLLGAGGYDGDLIFENLELMRTVRAAGGRVDIALGLFVRRLPPETRHFLSQRVRQAYDDFAIPARAATWLCLGPFAGWASRRWPASAAVLAVTAIGLAEAGRRRAGGTAVYHWSSSLLAPAWLAERSVCAWLALGQYLSGGASYAGRRIPRAANSPAALESRYRAASSPPTALKPLSL